MLLKIENTVKYLFILLVLYLVQIITHLNPCIVHFTLLVVIFNSI